MIGDLSRALQTWLDAGGSSFGEIAIRLAGAGFRLTHRDETESVHLEEHTVLEAARYLANFDDAGAFRPLKTAPNLRHGWALAVPDVESLRRALDFFYPAMTGVWCRHEAGALHPVPLRETLGRQSGMYRVTQKISDPQAQALIGSMCRSDGGCLKNILWKIAPGQPVVSLPAEKLRPQPTGFPLLCHEACNLLVAKAREVVKGAAA